MVCAKAAKRGAELMTRVFLGIKLNEPLRKEGKILAKLAGYTETEFVEQCIMRQVKRIRDKLILTVHELEKVEIDGSSG